MKGLFTSEQDGWLTPKHIIESVVNVMGAIDLDPCSDIRKHIPAAVNFTDKEDGLSMDWFGRVFMNPPYGGKISSWAKKWRGEYEKHHFERGIALVPARTDTEWWRDLISTASIVCFIDGRLRFGDKQGEERAPSTFPSVVLYACRDDQNEMKIFSDEFTKEGNIWIKAQASFK